MVRTLVLWFPDWPVTAWARESGEADEEGPVGVVTRNLVVACSAAARRHGVRTGQRQRDAQALCPQLVVVAADEERDRRAFSPVVSVIEEITPGVQILRPGLCALKARGPSRYYGGEHAAAETLVTALAEHGVVRVRAGIADGPFAAERAARAAGDDLVRVVAPGVAAAFLAPMPVATLGDDALAGLLARLGVHTLGEFAAMDVVRVRERLGEHGVRCHEIAGGRDARPVVPRTPPPELHREVVFEPPLEVADQVAFGVRVAADELISGLGARSLVCTELRVELTGDRDERSERVWLHPASFDAAAVIDRVRWQLTEDAEEVLRSGVAHVRISPEAVDAASHHAVGLFGAGPQERVHHALSRVQAILGHRGVLTPALGGGRWLTERQTLVPWGDRTVLERDPSQPWPGSLPDPLPATVFPDRRPVQVADDGGAVVTVHERGVLTGAPAYLTIDGRRVRVIGWAGPWPVRERGWDPARARSAHRFQVVTDAGAWLLVLDGVEWAAEGRYD